MPDKKKTTEHIIDAKGKTLGRLASEIAVILQGKKHVSYLPREAGSDRVIVKNAAKIVVTGKKMTQKIYYRHTGYMGHLRKNTLRELMEKDPTRALEYAVFNMLPKNFLRQKRMNRLKIEA